MSYFTACNVIDKDRVHPIVFSGITLKNNQKSLQKILKVNIWKSLSVHYIHICFTQTASLILLHTMKYSDITLTLYIYMWRHLAKPDLNRNKQNRFWSSATRSTWRRIRAWTFCHIWASTENIFIASCTIKTNLRIPTYGACWYEKTLFAPK